MKSTKGAWEVSFKWALNSPLFSMDEEAGYIARSMLETCSVEEVANTLDDIEGGSYADLAAVLRGELDSRY